MVSAALTTLGGEPRKDYPADAAKDALTAACRKAAAESKVVFLKSGYPECGWCRVFDRYHERPAVREIIEKRLVVPSIDAKYTPDGRATFSRFAKPSAPSWVIKPRGYSGIPLSIQSKMIFRRLDDMSRVTGMWRGAFMSSSRTWRMASAFFFTD